MVSWSTISDLVIAFGSAFSPNRPQSTSSRDRRLVPGTIAELGFSDSLNQQSIAEVTSTRNGAVTFNATAQPSVPLRPALDELQRQLDEAREYRQSQIQDIGHRQSYELLLRQRDRTFYDRYDPLGYGQDAMNPGSRHYLRNKYKPESHAEYVLRGILDHVPRGVYREYVDPVGLEIPNTTWLDSPLVVNDEGTVITTEPTTRTFNHHEKGFVVGTRTDITPRIDVVDLLRLGPEPGQPRESICVLEPYTFDGQIVPKSLPVTFTFEKGLVIAKRRHDIFAMLYQPERKPGFFFTGGRPATPSRLKVGG